MNKKIEKVCAEIEKTKAKISEYNARLRELEKQKTELENTEIVELVRGVEASPAELAALPSGKKADFSRPRKKN